MPTLMFFALLLLFIYCIHLLIIMRHAHIMDIPHFNERYTFLQRTGIANRS